MDRSLGKNITRVALSCYPILVAALLFSCCALESSANLIPLIDLEVMNADDIDLINSQALMAFFK